MDRIPRTCPEYQEEIPSVCKRKVSSCVPSFFPHYMRKILSFSPGLKSSVWTASFSVLCFCFLQRCQQWSQPYMTAQEIYLFMKKVSEGNLVRMSCWHWGQKTPVVLIQPLHEPSGWRGLWWCPSYYGIQTLQVIDGVISCSPPSDIIHYTGCSYKPDAQDYVLPLRQVKHFAPYMRDDWTSSVSFPHK